MPVSDTPGYSVSNYRLPPFGEMDLAPNRALKVAEFVWAAGTDTTAFVAVAATDSDSYVDALVDTQETFAAFEVGYDPVFIKSVNTRIITAFTASVTHTIGDTDDADGYLIETNIGSTTAFTGAVNAPAVEQDTAVVTPVYGQANFWGGKFYDASSSDDSLDIVIGAADPAAGRGAMYVAYFTADHAIYV